MRSLAVHLVIFILCAFSAAVLAGEAIPFSEAPNCTGQTKTVTGTVTGTHTSTRSGNLYLNFGDYKKDLSVKIPADVKSKFSAESDYSWKKIEATGEIVKEKGKLRLIVTDPAKLKILKAKAPAECAKGPISYKEAPNCIGQRKTVTGTVVKTITSKRSGNFYLNFGDYKKDLSVKIPVDDKSKFPADAATLYMGKEIEATGDIVVEKKKLRMIVMDPAGIKIIGEGSLPKKPKVAARRMSWQEAMGSLGEDVIVEGTIVNVHTRERGPDMLNFSKDWKNSLGVAVFKKEKFGDLKAKYLNKKVEVKGTVSEYRGSKQIKIYDPSSIKVVK